MLHTTLLQMTGSDIVFLYLLCMAAGAAVSLALGVVIATIKALFF